MIWIISFIFWWIVGMIGMILVITDENDFKVKDIFIVLMVGVVLGPFTFIALLKSEQILIKKRVKK